MPFGGLAQNTAEHLAAPVQLLWLRSYTAFLLTWHCYCMPMSTHYCLVPHPMAVLGRKPGCKTSYLNLNLCHLNQRPDSETLQANQIRDSRPRVLAVGQCYSECPQPRDGQSHGMARPVVTNCSTAGDHPMTSHLHIDRRITPASAMNLQPCPRPMAHSLAQQPPFGPK
jgi:hypothetical protein